MDIHGRYNTAHVFAPTAEDEALLQLKTLCDMPFVEGERIAVMPDIHAGKGCTIGYTQTLQSGRVCPSLVGVDIACGVLTVPLGRIGIDLQELDRFVRRSIPAGFQVNASPLPFDLSGLVAPIRGQERILCSIGSLGGGNHFIEVDEGDDGLYLLIHSGSRNLGVQVASYWQDRADASCNHHQKEFEGKASALIERLKAQGRQGEIKGELKRLKAETTFERIPHDLAWLEGEEAQGYLSDMAVCRRFAQENRRTIAKRILGHLGFDDGMEGAFDTLHNYISEDGVLRKGAVDASLGKRLVIPINMRDGALICIGLGNEAYNRSAPHGAGRLMSRAQARKSLSMDDFRREMQGICSSSVVPGTLDESPMAYKALKDIEPMLSPSARIEKRIRPVYNFKAV